MVASPVARKLVVPPALVLLPRPVRMNGVLLSTAFHLGAMAAYIWLPVLFSFPVVADSYNSRRPELASDSQPLVMPSLPPLQAAGSSPRESTVKPPEKGTLAASRSASPQPQKRDYAGSQEIVSDMRNAVNRVQTIRRPDLVAPPNLKFPLRLQSMVILPALAAPRLAPQPPRPIAAPIGEVPVPQATVLNPKLMKDSKLVSAPASEAVPPPVLGAQPNASNLTALTEAHARPPKAVVVVNAVSVPPDSAAEIPDAQLAGSFVVGPSHETGVAEKLMADGRARLSDTGLPGNGAHSSDPGLTNTAGADPGTGHAPGAAGGTSASAGTGRGTVSAHLPGSGSGVTGRGTGNVGTTGIYISGGMPDRNGATPTNSAIPQRRSYGMTIISGGSSGGAGRDMGVFDRSETVYSVAIPMGDVGGPDWPMQYSILNQELHDAGLLVPPFVQKKIGVTMKGRLMGGPGPLFVTGIIDQEGKLQSLRSIRTQDARSQPAIQALQQWEFLPAQMDGRPVACKVLIGVTVIAEE